MHGANYRSRKEAGERMVRSAKLASRIYQCIEKEKRHKALYTIIQKEVNTFFKVAIGFEETVAHIASYLHEAGYLSSTEALAITAAIGPDPLHIFKRSTAPHKKTGCFSGVRIRTNEGRWVRIYHPDELALLHTYGDRMGDNEAWLTDFLVKRKKLPTYCLKHTRRRKMQQRSSDHKRKSVANISVKSQFPIKTFVPEQHLNAFFIRSDNYPRSYARLE